MMLRQVSELRTYIHNESGRDGKAGRFSKETAQQLEQLLDGIEQEIAKMTSACIQLPKGRDRQPIWLNDQTNNGRVLSITFRPEFVSVGMAGRFGVSKYVSPHLLEHVGDREEKEKAKSVSMLSIYNMCAYIDKETNSSVENGQFSQETAQQLTEMIKAIEQEVSERFSKEYVKLPTGLDLEPLRFYDQTNAGKVTSITFMPETVSIGLGGGQFSSIQHRPADMLWHV